MNELKKIKASLKKYTWLLYFLKRDKRVNKKVKLIILITLAYALCPIDLIPDFIPILGLLDDLIIIPLGIFVVIKLIPKDVLNDCNQSAENCVNKGEFLPKNWTVALIIIVLWIIIIGLTGKLFYLKFF